MPRQSVVARVERFEERVTILEELPSRVDALSTQISQVRDEMHREFSNVHNEIHAGDDAVMDHARELHESLKAQIQAVDDRVMNHTRMLHEDLKADLKLIREGQSSGPRRRRRPKS